MIKFGFFFCSTQTHSCSRVKCPQCAADMQFSPLLQCSLENTPLVNKTMALIQHCSAYGFVSHTLCLEPQSSGCARCHSSHEDIKVLFLNIQEWRIETSKHAQRKQLETRQHTWLALASESHAELCRWSV